MVWSRRFSPSLRPDGPEGYQAARDVLRVEWISYGSSTTPWLAMISA